MKITQADLLAMSTEELQTLNKMIVATFKAKRTIEGATIASDLKVKQEIKVNVPNHKDDIFIIEKINKTKASITLKGTNKGFTVPFSMIITKW